MEYSEDKGQRLATEFMAKQAARPVKATYDLATLGAKTRQGGEVATACTDMQIDGHRVACVGDTVRYPDGSESKIVSGAGFALAYKDLPVAIVGSATDNGDTIISSLQNASKIWEYADDEGIPGRLRSDYVVPQGGGAWKLSAGFETATRPHAVGPWQKASVTAPAVGFHSPSKVLEWPVATTV